MILRTMRNARTAKMEPMDRMAEQAVSDTANRTLVVQMREGAEIGVHSLAAVAKYATLPKDRIMAVNLIAAHANRQEARAALQDIVDTSPRDDSGYLAQIRLQRPQHAESLQMC